MSLSEEDTSNVTAPDHGWACSASNLMESTRIVFCLTNDVTIVLLFFVVLLWVLRPATRNLENFISINMCLTASISSWLVSTAFFSTATWTQKHCRGGNESSHPNFYEDMMRYNNSLSFVPRFNTASVVMCVFEMWWCCGLALYVWISSDARKASFFRGFRQQKYNMSIVVYYGIPLVALASLFLAVRHHYAPSVDLPFNALLDFVFASTKPIDQLALLTRSDPPAVFLYARYVHCIISYGVPLLICTLVYVEMLRTWKTRPLGTVYTVFTALAISLFALACIATYIITVTTIYNDPRVFSGKHTFLILLQPFQAIAVCVVHMCKAANRSAWVPCARESALICTDPTECTRRTAISLFRDFELS